MSGKRQQQERARQVYEEVGSIKRTARKLKCSKAEAKRLLGTQWLEEQRQRQREETLARRQNRKQQKAEQKGQRRDDGDQYTSHVDCAGE